MPRNAIQITYDDGSVQVLAPAPSPQPAPAPVQSAIIKGVYADGITDSQVKAYADPFGAGWIRCWHTINWSEKIGPGHPTIVRANTLQKQGLGVLIVCTPPEKTGMPAPTPQIAADYFLALGQAANNGAYPNRSVFAWEIYNEPNLANYNADYAAHSSSWITNALQPAYQVLNQTLGHFVVSGGWSEGPNNGFSYAISKGLLNYCDAVGYHPYGPDAPTQYQRVQAVRSLIGNKPLWLTEWNLHMDPANPAAWTQNLQQAAAAIRSYVNAVFHFRLVQTTQPAGVAAPFDVNSNRRPVWYDGTVAAMGVF